MSEAKKDAPQVEEPKTGAAETELPETEMEDVAGGLNPQPLPPYKFLT